MRSPPRRAAFPSLFGAAGCLEPVKVEASPDHVPQVGAALAEFLLDHIGNQAQMAEAPITICLERDLLGAVFRGQQLISRLLEVAGLHRSGGDALLRHADAILSFLHARLRI